VEFTLDSVPADASDPIDTAKAIIIPTRHLMSR